MLTETYDPEFTPVELVSRIDNLISLPEVWLRIQEKLRDPLQDWHAIAAVISYDPALTSRILQLVNSAFFGQQGRVERLSQAIALVGEIELNNIVTVAAVVHAIDKLSNPLPHLDHFWMHSVRCAILARHLARLNRVLHPERLFVAGLLHDIGRMVIHQLFPKAGQQLYGDLNTASAIRAHQERSLLGFDHGDVGAALARHWTLPESLCCAIQFHHYPEQADEYAIETSIVHIANELVHLTEEDAPELDPASLARASLSPRALQLCPLDPDATAEAIAETIVEAVVVQKSICG